MTVAKAAKAAKKSKATKKKDTRAERLKKLEQLTLKLFEWPTRVINEANFTACNHSHLLIKN